MMDLPAKIGSSIGSSGLSNKKKDDKQEAMLFARRGLSEFSFEIEREGRASLDELDEQVLLLGNSCTDELLKARDEAVVAYKRMSGMFGDCEDTLSALARRSMGKE